MLFYKLYQDEQGRKVGFLQGNEACLEAALIAGLEFFAGYPITPSSEIAAVAAEKLPMYGGRFIQMEIKGNLRNINLSNLLLVLNMIKATGFLVLDRGYDTGAIYMENGEVIGATLGYIQGEDAVYKMLHWIFGTYEFNHRLIAPQGKLDINLWELINEGLRKTFVYHRFREIDRHNNHKT